MRFVLTKERKYLLVFGSILLVIGAFYRFKPGVDFSPGSDDITMKKQQVIRYRQIIAEKKQIDERLVSLKNKASAAVPLLFDTASASLAAVEIQNTVNEAAASLGVTIKSTDVMKEAVLGKDSRYVGVPVRLTAEMDVKQLREMILKFETAPKYLTIKELACTVADSKKNSISVVMTVEGYMEKKAG